MKFVKINPNEVPVSRLEVSGFIKNEWLVETETDLLLSDDIKNYTTNYQAR